MAARLEAPRADVRPVTVTAPARRAGDGLPAVAELAAVGAGYLGCALVRLAIHVAAASPGGHRIPVMRGYLPAFDHGVMDPAPAEVRAMPGPGTATPASTRRQHVEHAAG